MNVKPLAELAPHVAGRSVALVGNAPSLLGAGLAVRIDGCDLVVRMNNYRVDHVLAASVGSRRDVYLCSFWYTQDKITKTSQEVLDHRLIVCPFSEIHDPASPRHQFAASLIGSGIVYAPTEAETAALELDLGAAPVTTGLLGAYLFAKLLAPRSLLICGFDCFTDINNVHYYEKRGHTGFSHDLIREREWLCQLADTDLRVDWFERNREKTMGSQQASQAGRAEPRRYRIAIQKTEICSRREPDHWRLKEYLTRNGHTLVSRMEDADYVLLDTCSFNQFTEDTSIAAVERLKGQGPELVVVGCLPRAAEQRLAFVHPGHSVKHREYENLDPLFFRTTSYADLRDSLFKLPVLNDRSAAMSESGRSVQIQAGWGCADKCTFCGDKAAVGHIRSRPLDELVAETRQAIADGAQYVAIVGDDVAAMGVDRDYTVFDFLEAVVAVPGDYKLDLYEMNPKYLVRDLPRLSRILATGHFGELTIAYQSGNDRILKLMGRGYTRSDMEALVQLLHGHHISVYTHVLAGTPGETEEDFEDTLSLFLDHRIEGGAFFGYQDVERAPAHRLPGHVEERVIRKRLDYAAERLALAEYDVVWREDKIQCYRVDDDVLSRPHMSARIQQVKQERARIRQRFDEAVAACLDAGIHRVVLYGTGRHSQRLGSRLKSCPLDILRFVDDNPARQGLSFLGFGIASLDQALELRPDAIIISTDAYETAIVERIRPKLTGTGVGLVTLYGAGGVRLESRATRAAMLSAV